MLSRLRSLGMCPANSRLQSLNMPWPLTNSGSLAMLAAMRQQESKRPPIRRPRPTELQRPERSIGFASTPY